MSLTFRTTKPKELVAIRDFLIGIFGTSPESPFAQRDHFEWKYFDNIRPCGASRSFVFENESGFVAHVCAWPFQVLLGGEGHSAIHPIDWAASSAVPGAGALLLRQLRPLADLTVCVGGTEAAQKVIATAGFKPLYPMKYYSRPLRPWRQFLTHQRRDVKLLPRLVRNTFWSVRAGRSAPPDWTATEIQPRDFPAEAIPASNADVTVCVRSAELFAYLMKCPIARYRLYLARANRELRGYFLISYVPGQAIVADAWTTSDRQEDWASIYRLAVSVAYQEGRVAEVVAGSALIAGQDALESMGFRAHQVLPIMVFDRRKILENAPRLHFQLIDSDFSFLQTGRPNYST